MRNGLLPTVRIGLVIVCVICAGVIGLNIHRRALRLRRTEEAQRQAISQQRELAQKYTRLYEAVNANSIEQFQTCSEQLRPYLALNPGFHEAMLEMASRGKTEMLACVFSRNLVPIRSAGRSDLEGKLLTVAAMSGKTDVVKMLLVRGVNPTGLSTWPVLSQMASQRLLIQKGLNIARMLIHAGADVNARVTEHHIATSLIPESYRYTPLMLAARAGNINMVRLLLNAHADTTLRTPQNEDAAAIAKRCHQPAIAKLLVRRRLSLRAASLSGHPCKRSFDASA